LTIFYRRDVFYALKKTRKPAIANVLLRPPIQPILDVNYWFYRT